MGFFILIAILFGALWLTYSARKVEKEETSFSALDEAEPWFQKNKINSSSVVFSSYNEPALVRHYHANVLVGVGDDSTGNRIGFALEVVAGRGVMESTILIPSGIATWHKDAAMQAKIANIPLIDVLNKMAEAHKNRKDEKAAEHDNSSSQTDNRVNINGPSITNAIPIRAYSSGKYNATLIHKIESIGAIKYIYALIVFESENENPILFVTSERNSMIPEMLSSLPEELQDAMKSMSAEAFMGIFDKSGRQNLGSSAQYATIDGFEVAALSVAQKNLGISSQFQRSN